MNNLNTFQVILLSVFGLAAFVAILIFSGVLPGTGDGPDGVGGIVVLWGSVREAEMNAALKPFKEKYEGEFTLNYVYQDPRNLEANLVEALAAGRGPDLVIFPHTSIMKRYENIAALSYDNYSQLQFTTNFVREGKLYLSEKGILALPLFLDPLVLYANTDILATARLVEAPTTWKELEEAIKVLNRIDQNKNLLASALPLGKSNNINNAQDLLALLVMQAGNTITALQGDGLEVVLAQNADGGKTPAVDALNYFNRFSNSVDTLYSWNSAQPEARDAFLRGTTAMYLGYASEYPLIKRQNPQLNLEVSVVPQLSKTSAVTVGRMYGISLLRGSRNPVTAVRAMSLLSEAMAAKSLAETLGLAPARKELVRSFPTDPARSIFYQSAIFASGWLDPDPTQSKAIFQRLIENSQSGIVETGAAVARAQEELQLLSN